VSGESGTLRAVDDEAITYTTCPICQERIDPTDPSLLYGFEQKDVTGFGQSRAMADGLGGYLHEECFPGLASYRPAPRP
jgi:hypothetical protein